MSQSRPASRQSCVMLSGIVSTRHTIVTARPRYTAPIHAASDWVSNDYLLRLSLCSTRPTPRYALFPIPAVLSNRHPSPPTHTRQRYVGTQHEKERHKLVPSQEGQDGAVFSCEPWPSRAVSPLHCFSIIGFRWLLQLQLTQYRSTRMH